MPKIKKAKKPSISKLKKECDALVKEIVSIRDKDICQKCGKKVYGSNRQRSHVIPVSAGNKLAFDPMNIKVLCYYCHIQWWHKNPLEAQAWFKRKFPERFEYLMSNRGIMQMRYQDWVELRQSLALQLGKEA